MLKIHRTTPTPHLYTHTHLLSTYVSDDVREFDLLSGSMLVSKGIMDVSNSRGSALPWEDEDGLSFSILSEGLLLNRLGNFTYGKARF